MKEYSVEIKPCPHCGKESELQIRGNKAFILCSDRNCLGMMQVEWGTEDSIKEFVGKLVNDWNSRNKDKEIELLRRFYKEVEVDMADWGCESDYTNETLVAIDACLNKIIFLGD